MTPVLELHSRELLQRLNVAAEPVGDEQYVHASNAALRAVSIVGVRRKEDDPFTGWEIVAASEDPGAAQFGYSTVKELAAEHPAWLVALQLPVGWAFRFVGNTLVDCVSPEGVTHRLGIEVKLQ